MSESIEHRFWKGFLAKVLRGTTEYRCPRRTKIQRPDACGPLPRPKHVVYVDCRPRRRDGVKPCSVEIRKWPSMTVTVRGRLPDLVPVRRGRRIMLEPTSPLSAVRAAVLKRLMRQLG